MSKVAPTVNFGVGGVYVRLRIIKGFPAIGLL